MRVYALFILVAFLVVYAWKDWFKAACGLVLLMAVLEHPDMPKNMFGIQGFNLWNVLLLSVAGAWLASRRQEGLRWDMPRSTNVLLILFAATIVVGFLRAVVDRSHIEYLTLKDLLSEQLINTLKWLIPGVLIYDGCRTRKRAVMVIAALLIMSFVLGVQVIKRLPTRCAFEQSKEIDGIRLRACDRLGYSRCDMSAILAGASWAMLATVGLLRRKMHKALLLGAAGMTAYGQALTGGRAGYIAWGATGIVLCLVRWRKGLLLAPFVPLVLMAVFPGAAKRALTGFGVTDASGETVVDKEEVTADRAVIWPEVIAEIGKSPVIGFGRLGMLRTGLHARLGREYAEAGGFAHPHNMYLEWTLDNGVVGLAVIAALFAILLYRASRLFRSSDPLLSAVGGVGLSLTLAQLFAGIGAQHFYPNEGALGMWAAVFLVLRASRAADRSRAATPAQADGGPLQVPSPSWRQGGGAVGNAGCGAAKR